MRPPLLTLLSAAVAVSAAPYEEYILAPPSRTIRPVDIFGEAGPLSSPNALLDGHTSSGSGLVLDAFNSSVTYDFGKNIGGWVNLDVLSSNGSIGVTFSESSIWVSSETSDASVDFGLDAQLVFNITDPGHYQAVSEKERGGFRYLTVVNLGSTEVAIKDLWVHFTAMPHWEDDALRDYTGWFHSNDEKLNRVWYAGAYTAQLSTIDATRGDTINLVSATPSEAPTSDILPWWVNTTITNGTSALVDGAKRDRLVWSGDMTISIPSVAVTTSDLISARNSLDSLFELQLANGLLPYSGSPFNAFVGESFTYHLHTLIGVANVYRWGGDQAYLDDKWEAWKAGMEWAADQIDETGLANVTADTSSDWLRFGMGGHNIEANAILFYTLNLGVTLATVENETATADRWSQLATGIQTAATPLLWQPDVGLFRDNETTTLAPQDGNAWAVKSGLVTSPSQTSQISAALQARWGPYGAPAPEAADAVSPFVSGFELDAHFLAGRTAAALELVRSMWADFMLDDPRMTNSTLIEGYSTGGELRYPPYPDDACISHAHGWSTGPTSSLTTYVGGIQILSAGGATWQIAPQLGDLTHVDVGLTTPKGVFSSKWSLAGKTLRLKISAPQGTTGSVGLPLPNNSTKATLTGGSMRREKVEGDTSGRFWVNDLPGGDYQFVITGL